MREAEEDPAAVGAARGAGRQENSATNRDSPDASALVAAASAIGEAIRRYLPELAALDRWIVRDAGKAPKHPRTRYDADASDRAIWCSLDRALTVWQEHPREIAGVGFVMTGINAEHPELRLIGIDLDKAFDELDMLKPWARRIFDAAGSCYWERSPSGRGLRGFMRGVIPAEIRSGAGKFGDTKARPFAPDSGGIELYDGRSKQYLTVTGGVLCRP